MFGFPHHLDLTVSNVQSSIEFYDKVLTRLGYDRTDQYSGGAPCWLYSSKSAPVFGIALHEAKTSVVHDRYSPGMHHLAFNAQSRAQIDAFFEYLVESGIAVLDAPAEYSYTPGYYAVFFADPDGMKLELVYEPSFHSAPGQVRI